MAPTALCVPNLRQKYAAISEFPPTLHAFFRACAAASAYRRNAGFAFFPKIVPFGDGALSLRLIFSNVERLREKFAEVYGGGGETEVFFAPGRVCFLGDHLDYNGGTVLTFALPMGVYAAVRYRDDDVLRLFSERGDGASVAHRPGQIVETSWVRYPAGVYDYLLGADRPENDAWKGYNVRGADVYYHSTLPIGAGLSSSAALEVVTAFALLYPLFGEKTDKVEIARLCKRVENRFVGVNCGIMDQFSVALGLPDRLLTLDCSDESHRFSAVDLEGVVWVAMNTNVPRALRESKYNERRAECETALAAMRENRPSLRALAHADVAAVRAAKLPENVRKRAEYVVEEQARVMDCIAALKRGDVEKVGRLMNESHAGLQGLYEVTGTHLDALCAAARSAPGAVGARMTGAGFGGCAIALVIAGAETEFIRSVGENYRRATGMEADFYVVRPSPGVRRLGD